MKGFLFLVLVVFVNVALAVELVPFKRTYNYYLDPTRAEEILGGISLLPRITKENWLEKIGKKKNNPYKVRSGDSLWTISKGTLGDPWLWRKLWQENPELLNPHDLSVGQILAYYRGELDVEPLYVPIIKLLPSRRGGVVDLDSDTISGSLVRNQLRMPFIIVDEEEVLGEVTGAYTRAEALNGTEEVYLSLDDKEKVKPGDEFSIVRFEREIRDSTTDSHKFLGRLMKVTGGVKVTQVGERLVKTEIVEDIYPIQRGDKVISHRGMVYLNPHINPPEDLRMKIVASEHLEHNMYGEGHLVLLNMGDSDGVKEGQLFRVARDTDPVTESDKDVEPDYKGEIAIVLASKTASIGYITKSKGAMLVGDTLLAAQLFLPPAPRPKREKQTLILQ